MTDIEPIYHLKDAAERCGVTPKVLRSWFRQGLRHVPLTANPRAKASHLRDAIVRESWLIAFLDSKARIRVPLKADPEKPAGKPARRGRVKADSDSPLGPCPC